MTVRQHITVERADPATPEALALLEASWRYLASLFKPEERFHLDLAGLRAPHIHFFLARTAKRATGCAALAVFGDWAEVKSMYIDTPARGTGLSTALLEQLEHEAVALGCHTLRLETGITLQRARAFYTRQGFHERGPFASYRAIPTSVFMEKALPRAN